ncbi:MAG: transglycosylase SLT domain-containing protein [Acidobacteria bacterium]|nr:transglycosylase SLT domain-containing protein [Acidobacteriota bacterium]
MTLALSSVVVCCTGDSRPAPEGAATPATLPPGSRLPNDAACAAGVGQSHWEPRPDNATPNHTSGVACSEVGACSAWQQNIYEFAARVDGRFTGTTDQILQWGACKWGIEANLLRAVATRESTWRQSQVGDYTRDSKLCSSFGQSAPCYQSYGLLQVKASAAAHPATYPYSQASTAFNVDFAAAWLRSCFEGTDRWLAKKPQSSRGYSAGDIWGCVGAWYSGAWYDAGAQDYIEKVKQFYLSEPWLKPGF